MAVTLLYRTASVLIAYESRTSKVCLAYLQRIWTSWCMPDDWVTYLTYNLRIITLAIRRVPWSYAEYAGHTQSTLVIHRVRWSYAEYAGHTQSTLVIRRVRWSYTEYAGHTLTYAGHTQSTLVIRRVRWSYTEYAGHTQSTLVLR